MIKYRYFVSYVYVSRNGGKNEGNCYVDVTQPITSMLEVMNVQEYLRKDNNWASIVIMNYIFLGQIAVSETATDCSKPSQ